MSEFHANMCGGRHSQTHDLVSESTTSDYNLVLHNMGRSIWSFRVSWIWKKHWESKIVCCIFRKRMLEVFQMTGPK